MCILAEIYFYDFKRLNYKHGFIYCFVIKFGLMDQLKLCLIQLSPADTFNR